MKLLVDFNVSRHVVDLLRKRGFDITRVGDVLSVRTPDEAIIAEARRINAVVISHDQDFTAILATTGATTPSLINLRMTYVDADRIAGAITAVIETVADKLDAGAIVSQTISAISIRGRSAEAVQNRPENLRSREEFAYAGGMNAESVSGRCEKLSIAEIEQRFPDQWIVLVDYDFADMNLTAGAVFAHDRDRAALRSTIKSLADCAVIWTGKKTSPVAHLLAPERGRVGR